MQFIKTDKDKINVVYLGGSITQGAHSSTHQTCYACLSCDWLKKQYGEDKINYINKGVGGTSSVYGILRLEHDVLSNKPDLLFVEFAVNDAAIDSRKYVESIIRSLKKLETVPYVIFLYTTDNLYSTPTENFEKIAEYYGIPQISLKNALKEHLGGKNPTENGYFSDSVHPLDAGHKVYADKVIECLSKEEYYKKPLLDKPPLNDDAFDLHTELVSSKQAKTSGVWNHGVIHEPILGDNEYSVTTEKGAYLELTFTGNAVAFKHGLHKNGGSYDVYIDGVFQKNVSSFFENCESNQLVLGYYNMGLEHGEHTIKIVACEAEKQVLIYNFLIGNKKEVL